MGKADESDMFSRQDVSPLQKETSPRKFIAPPLQIVVADDDQVLCQAIAATLRGAGYQVLTAAGADAAQSLLGEQPPALVLTELWMREGNGWDLLLHCQTRWPLVPVLLMSQSSLGLHPEIECWAAGFLVKPFSMSHLLSEVSRLAAHRTVAQYPNPAGLVTRRSAG
jgi:DNA-binding NtrC family response regulator